jgi:Putative peptidoglycan binding domain
VSTGNIYTLALDTITSTKTSNFPEDVYNLNPTDNLTLLLKVLLGDAGAGQLTLAQTTASNTQNLSGIEFSDLDNIAGSLLGSARLSTEEYGVAVDPFQSQLLRTTWDTIQMADSSYRERLALMLTAINSGATVLGLTLLCEAILGNDVRIVEAWRAPFSGGAFYYPTPGAVPSYNSPSNQVGPLQSSMFNTNSITEFLIVPNGETNYPQDIVQEMLHLVELLKPENSIATFYVPNKTYSINYGPGTNTLIFSNNLAPRASDIYRLVTGSGIPEGTFITSIQNLSSTYDGNVIVTLSNNTTASGTSITIDPDVYDVPLTTKQIVSENEWFEYDVIAASSSNITKTGLSELSKFSDRYWLNPAQMVTAPVFAHRTSVEEEIDLTSTVTNIQMVYYPSPDSVTIPTVNGPIPVITGNAQVGQILTVTSGSWTNDTILTYQWYSNKVAIPGANNIEYVTTNSDVGNTITVAVTGNLTYASPVTRTSAPFGPIVPITVTPVPAPNNTSQLYSINQLTIGGLLTSQNGRYFCVMQGDGNFVVYDKTPNYAITVPSSTLYGTLKPHPAYGSSGPDVITLQKDLNYIAGANLLVDGLMGVDTTEAVMNFQRFFGLTIDGICGPITWGVIGYILNLKSSQTPKALWSTGTAGRGGNRVVVQGDGNLVVYTASNIPVWASGSRGSNVVLIMQDDGNLVLYETSGPNKWQIYGFPHAVWSWMTGSLTPDTAGYNAWAASVNAPTPPPVYVPTNLPPVATIPPPPTVVYGQWISIGLADSPDNFPNGMYPGDPNHYTSLSLNYTGATNTLANIISLSLNNVRNIPAASAYVPGTGSLTTTNGTLHTFNFTGIDTVSNKLTGITFLGNLTDTLNANTIITIKGNYNFEWNSQSDYIKYIVAMVNKLKGEFDNVSNPTQYRLPVSGAYWNQQDPPQTISLSQILAPASSQIVATVYGAI